uniref:Uncharacterized protein n=1 Tax=Caenorhabditis japonica TaxID=281687 RepID=A0A8R1E4L0_CAEJA
MVGSFYGLGFLNGRPRPFSPLIPQSSWLNWTHQEISLPSSTGRWSPLCRTTTSKQHQGDQWSTPRKLLVLLVVPIRSPTDWRTPTTIGSSSTAKQFRREWFQGDDMARRMNSPMEYNLEKNL